MYKVLSSPCAFLPFSGAMADASDPSGSLSFLEAVQKQMGLKVETHKRAEKIP